MRAIGHLTRGKTGEVSEKLKSKYRLSQVALMNAYEDYFGNLKTFKWCSVGFWREFDAHVTSKNLF